MKTVCPICEGFKKFNYEAESGEIKTVLCWACRGDGEVCYKVGVDFCNTTLDSLTKITYGVVAESGLMRLF